MSVRVHYICDPGCSCLGIKITGKNFNSIEIPHHLVLILLGCSQEDYNKIYKMGIYYEK